MRKLPAIRNICTCSNLPLQNADDARSGPNIDVGICVIGKCTFVGDRSIRDDIDARNDPDDVSSDSDDVCNDPDDVINDPDDVSSDPDDISSDPDDVCNDPDDVINDSGDVSSDPDDVSSDSDDVCNDPDDVELAKENSPDNIKIKPCRSIDSKT